MEVAQRSRPSRLTGVASMKVDRSPIDPEEDVISDTPRVLIVHGRPRDPPWHSAKILGRDL
jgi:hypothetical protein